MNETPKRKLLLVEWQDSTQPKSNWMFFEDMFNNCGIVNCQSVGFEVKNTPESIVICPNLGIYDDGEGEQGSGLISIPQKSVIRIIELTEQGVNSLNIKRI